MDQIVLELEPKNFRGWR